jgi:hypothetical protein
MNCRPALASWSHRSARGAQSGAIEKMQQAVDLIQGSHSAPTPAVGTRVQIEQFLVIQLVTSAVVAVATGGALWAMGLQHAALWGLLAGIFDSIPYYGPLLVTAGLTVVGFLQFGTIGMTIAVAGVSLLITALEGSLLIPTLMSRVDEPDCDLHQAAILELDLGRVGHAARGADDDGDQGDLRSRGANVPPV